MCEDVGRGDSTGVGSGVGVGSNVVACIDVDDDTVDLDVLLTVNVGVIVVDVDTTVVVVVDVVAVDTVRAVFLVVVFPTDSMLELDDEEVDSLPVAPRPIRMHAVTNTATNSSQPKLLHGLLTC